MKELKKITIQNLKLNKKRSIVTIIGILLSVALITAVATMVTSFRESMIEYEKKVSGNYEYAFFDVPSSEISFLKNNRSISDLFITNEIGYAKVDSQNLAKPYVYVISMDKKAMDNLGVSLVEGALPKNDNEIVIPTSLKTNGRLDYKIGDYITLNIGKRESDGYKLNQNNPYDDEVKEEITNINTKTYKIVGIIKRLDIEPYTAPGYTLVTYSEKEAELNNVYVSLTSSGLKNRYNVVGGIIGVSGKTLENFENGEVNDEMAKAKYDHTANTYLIKILASSFDDGTMRALITVATVVIIIIIFTSVYCIKSSFNISYTEKIKSYAHLITVGATSKQIKKSVYYESFILGFIGIILGLLGGVFAAYVLIKIVNLLLGKSFVVEGFLIFKTNLLAIIISIILSLLTIYLSSRKIAKKASKVSPIEALRNPGEISIKSNKIKSPKLIDKLFGVGGVISYKNIKRNGKKYRTTVVSIIFCVAVYIGLSYFINSAFTVIKKGLGEYNYNIEVIFNDEDDKLRKEKISQIDSLGNINRISIMRTVFVNTKDLKFTEKALEYGFSNDDTSTVSIKTLGKKEYESYLQKLHISDAKDYDAIIINNSIYEENGSKVEYNVLNCKEGDTLTFTNESSNVEIKLTNIKSTSQRPLGLENSGEAPIIIVSDETMDKINDANIIKTTTTTTVIYIDSKNPDDTQDEIEKMFLNDDGIYINNVNESVEQMNSLYLIVAIFLYGFIIVIAIIGLTNIFNTITTNVSLRTSEFASLRSIGMTTKEFNRMIFLESFFYCTKALIIGIPIGIILSIIIHRALVGEMALIYHLPLKGITISVIVVFILIFSLMKYSTKKVNSKNILEAIRNENI